MKYAGNMKVPIH